MPQSQSFQQIPSRVLGRMSAARLGLNMCLVLAEGLKYGTNSFKIAGEIPALFVRPAIVWRSGPLVRCESTQPFLQILNSFTSESEAPTHVRSSPRFKKPAELETCQIFALPLSVSSAITSTCRPCSARIVTAPALPVRTRNCLLARALFQFSPGGSIFET